MESFGLSGKAGDVEEKLEFTPEHVAGKVWSAWMQRSRLLAVESREDTIYELKAENVRLRAALADAKLPKGAKSDMRRVDTLETCCDTPSTCGSAVSECELV